MNILKISVIVLMLNVIAKAESGPHKEANKAYEEDMIMTLCHSADHRFDSLANSCVYCAQGFQYDRNSSRCIGTPNILGKCYGEDHYRAKTQECVYCVSGYVFNEDPDIRECEPIKVAEPKKEKITEESTSLVKFSRRREPRNPGK